MSARDISGRIPLDVASNEEVKQAIRDEPRRRMDHGYKRATDQGRYSTTDAAAEGEGEEVVQSNKQSHFVNGIVEEGKVAEEDEDSERSDEEG